MSNPGPLQFRHGPTSFEASYGCAEGEPYAATVVDGSTVKQLLLLYIGGHGTAGNLLVGGGFQTCSGEPTFSAPVGAACFDTSNNLIWVSTGSSWIKFCVCGSSGSSGSGSSGSSGSGSSGSSGSGSSGSSGSGSIILSSGSNYPNGIMTTCCENALPKTLYCNFSITYNGNNYGPYSIEMTYQTVNGGWITQGAINLPGFEIDGSTASIYLFVTCNYPTYPAGWVGLYNLQVFGASLSQPNNNGGTFTWSYMGTPGSWGEYGFVTSFDTLLSI